MHREYFTASVFVLSGAELKATLIVEGPLADSSVNTGQELQTKIDEWTKSEHNVSEVVYTQMVDFEHLKPQSESDEEEDEHPKDEEIIDENDPDAAEKRRKRREKQREAFMKAKEKRDRQRALEQAKVREDGEPFQMTFIAPFQGWYRVCVQATFYQVSVR